MDATPDLFNIRWNNYSAVLLTVFNRLLDDGHFVDVTLACEGQSIKCHRLVLSACSTYFEKLLIENTYPHMVIYLKDMKFWQLRSLVTFMYTGEVSINQDKLSQLVRAAESLKIKGLATSKCMLPSSSGGGAGDASDEEEDEEGMLETIESDTSIKTEETCEDRESVEEPAAAAATRSPIGSRKRKSPSVLPRLLKMQRIEQPLQEACIPEVHIGADDQLDGEDSLNDHDQDGNGTMMEDESQELYLHESPIGFENLIAVNGSLRNRQTNKYDKEVRDSALAALGTGMSLRQCSEAFGIPRKTLSKWKSRNAAAAVAEENGNEGDSSEPLVKIPIATVVQDNSSDRAVRLQKAMELAVSGVTVRQAAAQFDIPRTTLCAYMKRQGVAAKRNFLPSSSSTSNVVAVGTLAASAIKPTSSSSTSAPSAASLSFPFLGLSEMMDELEQGSFSVAAESQ